MSARELPREAAALVTSAGIRGRLRFEPLVGGANNRVFGVLVDGRPRAVVKAYFSHPDDDRDRVGAEFRFATFGWRNGVRAVPQPLACDFDRRLGVYEFIEGSPVAPGEVTDREVGEALAFFEEVNRHRHEPDATRVSLASEACFSIADHLSTVSRRLGRLCDIGTGSTPPVDRDAMDFVRGEVAPLWTEVEASIRTSAAALREGLTGVLPSGTRCISPSDFGFHNAIRTATGHLRFIDFEYAGWDDPAKMVCDFFCQPKVPVPIQHYDRFAEAVMRELADPQSGVQRASMLLPAYRVKWCCILLNDFMPADARRRRFAASEDGDESERKLAQLEKARAALKVLR